MAFGWHSVRGFDGGWALLCRDLELTPNGLPPGTMTMDEALEVARRTAEAEGWPFLDPISVKFRMGRFGRPGHWFIRTSINIIGNTVSITIDDRTGSVVHKEWYCTPR
jgi:hypothetical protein